MAKLAQQAYEDDLTSRPNYEDGTPRPTWDELGKQHCDSTRDVIRGSWHPHAAERIIDEDTDETCPKCGEKGVAYGAACHMVD